MIRRNIDEGKYEYPSKPKKPKACCSQCGKGWTVHQIPKFCPECGTKTNYDELLSEWKAEVKAWREKCSKVDEMFKHDLFEYLDIMNHPKREKLFALAWDYGHSNGLNSVIDYAEELVELLD